MAEHLAAKYGMSEAEAEARLESLDQLAASEGLAYNLAKTEGGNTFDAHRLIHLGYEHGSEVGGALKEALLHAYFVDLKAISEPDVLADIGASCGLDRAEVEEMLAGSRFADAVRADEAEAAALGATGVPFFVIGRAFAVPGAQDADTFLEVLRRAWSQSVEQPAAGPGCEGDACSI